jgi:hypothetical protein
MDFRGHNRKYILMPPNAIDNKAILLARNVFMNTSERII